MRLVVVLLFAPLSSAVAEMRAPKIWDEKALADWATPIAAIGLRPEHFKSEEYYRVSGENLKTYPVYHPDREPPGYWEWLQKQTPQPLVDAKKLRTRQDWIRAGEVAFRELHEPRFRTFDRARILQARDRSRYDGIWTHADGSLFILRWVVTDRGLGLSVQACAACHGRVQANGRSSGERPRRLLLPALRVTSLSR